jgi:hypothetical protein
MIYGCRKSATAVVEIEVLVREVAAELARQNCDKAVEWEVPSTYDRAMHARAR